MGNVTPEEAWTGCKASVKHFRIFGSVCHRHIPDEKRRKLDDKSEPLLLVGYRPTRAYKLYDPVHKCIVVSRDVVVDESATWNWNEERITAVPFHFPDEDPPTRDDPIQAPPQSERGSQRNRFPSSRLTDYEVFSDNAVAADGDLVHMAFMADIEPVSWQQAIQVKEWCDAMKEELHSIEKNGTWELVDPPSTKTPIDVKWVFKLKLKPGGSIAKHKARLVARGFLQMTGIDYSEVYAPVARMETIRLVIAIASSKGWPLFQMNVKSAFLNGPLQEEVYVLQPPGFQIQGEEEKVYKLNKALYGLKQAPRAWNKRIDAFLQQ